MLMAMHGGTTLDRAEHRRLLALITQRDAEIEKLRADWAAENVERTNALMAAEERAERAERERDKSEADWLAAETRATEQEALARELRAERDAMVKALMECSAQTRQRDADPEQQLKWIERIAEAALARLEAITKEGE